MVKGKLAAMIDAIASVASGDTRNDVVYFFV
jgi:hypothetical protein